MPDDWTWAVNLAQVLASLASLAAVIIAVWGLREASKDKKDEQAEKRRDLAAQVSAWAVSEGLIGGSPDEVDGGVVIRNNSVHAIRGVDIKTGCRAELGAEPSDDGYPGQRLTIIPPGVYYLQQRGADGAGIWSAPIPVDTSGGKLVAELEQDGSAGRLAVDLVPIARTPEPKVVTYLAFDIADQGWQRNENGDLKERRTSQWEEEFAKSASKDLAAPRQRSNDFSKYMYAGNGPYTKHQLMHFIIQTFITLKQIRTKAQFEREFGAEVELALGQSTGARVINPELLLDRVGASERYTARDEKFVRKHGAIIFDGIEYRGGYCAGFVVVPDHGRVILKPVIDHFRRLPGYDIKPV